MATGLPSPVGSIRSSRATYRTSRSEESLRLSRRKPLGEVDCVQARKDGGGKPARRPGTQAFIADHLLNIEFERLASKGMSCRGWSWMSYIGKPFEHDLFVSYSHGAIAGADSS